MLCIAFVSQAAAIEPALPDTTLTIEGKRIEIREEGDRMKVKVYDITDNDGLAEDELVFEGHYQDGKSFERRRSANAITIPLPSWNRGFSGHWAGFGMGFANIADGTDINDINGVSLDSGNSLEYNLNVFEHSFRLSRYHNWAVVTGAGMRWSRYRIDTNACFQEVDGITSLVPAPEGITYQSSKLNITSLTLPLLLEWQSRKRCDDGFFLSLGVVGVIKTASSSRVSFRDAAGHKQKEKVDTGMNLRPVTMDFLFQAGYDWIGLYLKYSPMSLFESNKGPEIQPVSIGLQLHI